MTRLRKARIGRQGLAHLRDQRLEVLVGKVGVAVTHVAAGQKGRHGTGHVVRRQAELLFDLAKAIQQLAKLRAHLPLHVGRVGADQLVHAATGGPRGAERGRRRCGCRAALLGRRCGAGTLLAVHALSHRVDQVVLEAVLEAVEQVVRVLVVARRVANGIVGRNGQRSAQHADHQHRPGAGARPENSPPIRKCWHVQSVVRDRRAAVTGVARMHRPCTRSGSLPEGEGIFFAAARAVMFLESVNRPFLSCARARLSPDACRRDQWTPDWRAPSGCPPGFAVLPLSGAAAAQGRRQPAATAW